MKKWVPIVCSIASSAGVVLTAYFSAKNTIKAIELEKERETELDPKEKAKCYIPTIITAAATIALNITSGKMYRSEAAALAGALATISARNNNYRNAVKQRDPDLDRDICEDEAVRAFDYSSIDTNPDETWFYEPTSQQWFKSTLVQVQDAQLAVNRLFSQGGWVPFGYWLYCLGLKPKKSDYEIGWSAEVADDWSDACFIDVMFDIHKRKDSDKNRYVICYGWDPGPEDSDEYADMIKQRPWYQAVQEDMANYKRKMEDPNE